MKSPRRRRAITLAVVGVLVVGCVAAWGWFVWLPGHRPALQPGERLGIDVSHHQGEIAWSRVAADGISFAYIKATEGGDFVDERFAENWRGAAAAGIEHGAYHYFTLCTPGAVQADRFLSTVPDDPDALPPAVDLELAGNCGDRPDPASFERELRSFLARVEAATGQRALLYVGDDIEEAYGVRGAFHRPLWLPRFLLHPEPDSWRIWQVSAFSRVDGVDGPVDLDVMRP